MNALDEVKSNTKCYNKHMTDEFLDTLSPFGLIAFCHPWDREDLLKMMVEDGIISKNEMNSHISKMKKNYGHRKIA